MIIKTYRRYVAVMLINYASNVQLLKEYCHKWIINIINVCAVQTHCVTPIHARTTHTVIAVYLKVIHAIKNS